MPLDKNNLLKKDGNGYYRFALSEIQVIQKVLSLMKELDMIGNETGVEQKSPNIASSERTIRRNVNARDVP